MSHGHITIKVLLIDLDSQSSITQTSKADTQKPTIYEVLVGKNKINDAIQSVQEANIISGSNSLANIDAVLNGTGKEYHLKENLASIKDNYDFIVIDTPPSLSITSINALTASKYMLVPALAFINTPKEIAKINVEEQATTKDLIRIATYVPKELKKAFNIIAVQEERKLYEVINEALIKYVKDKNE
jgi:chromosome partitioning protein